MATNLAFADEEVPELLARQGDRHPLPCGDVRGATDDLPRGIVSGVDLTEAQMGPLHMLGGEHVADDAGGRMSADGVDVLELGHVQGEAVAEGDEVDVVQVDVTREPVRRDQHRVTLA